MQPIKFFKYNIILLFLIFSRVAFTQTAYLPEPTGNVISDFQSLLSQDEKEGLAVSIKENYLNNSNQLIVVSIPTKFLGDLTIEDYANQLFKKWKPGQQGLNNGVLFIIAGSRLDSVNRKVRIEVGYGLEGALPDLLTQRILKQLVVPHLKEYNYVKAIQLGSDAIVNAIKTENRGHKPIFKLKTNSSTVLTDNAGVLTTDEFIQLKKNIENSNFKNTTSSIYISEDDSSPDGGDCTVYYDNSNNFVVSNELFNLSIDPNISIDSIGRIQRNKQPNYTVFIYKNYQLSDDEKKQYETNIKLFLSKHDVASALQEVINLSNRNYRNNWVWALQIMLLLCIPFFISAFFIFKTKETRKQANTNPEKYNKGIITLMAALTLFISAAIVFVNLFLFIGLYYDYYELSFMFLIPLFLIHTTILIFGVVFVYRLMKYYLPNFFRASSTDSDGNYDSSSSSSGSSSSSDSSDSSSSNDDYGGGGGDSGGGGSSSDW